MGHARVDNISRYVNQRLKQCPVSIKEIADGLVHLKQKVHASEGAYEDSYMISEAIQNILGMLFKEGLVEAFPVTTEQKKVFKEWNTDEMTNWDCGMDGNGGEYGIFDSIKWSTNRKRLPIIKYVSN